MIRPKFITLEGGEGAGKTTQIARIAMALRAAGHEVVTTREPGGSPGAEDIRQLLTKGATDRWLPMSEILLFYAARVDHVERTIRPALDQGKWVVCDRFFDSTLAMQGYGYGFDRAIIAALRQATLGDFAPGLTLVLDLDPATGLARAKESQRFERMELSFHERLREGFLAIAAAEPERCAVIDAARDRDHVTADMLAVIARRYGLVL